MCAPNPIEGEGRRHSYLFIEPGMYLGVDEHHYYLSSKPPKIPQFIIAEPIYDWVKEGLRFFRIDRGDAHLYFVAVGSFIVEQLLIKFGSDLYHEELDATHRVSDDKLFMHKSPREKNLTLNEFLDELTKEGYRRIVVDCETDPNWYYLSRHTRYTRRRVLELGLEQLGAVELENMPIDDRTKLINYKQELLMHLKELADEDEQELLMHFKELAYEDDDEDGDEYDDDEYGPGIKPRSYCAKFPNETAMLSIEQRNWSESSCLNNECPHCGTIDYDDSLMGPTYDY